MPIHEYLDPRNLFADDVVLVPRRGLPVSYLLGALRVKAKLVVRSGLKVSDLSSAHSNATEARDSSSTRPAVLIDRQNSLTYRNWVSSMYIAHVLGLSLVRI